MLQATDSQIAMWRGAIALAWANGKLDDREKERLLKYFKDNRYLSDEQRNRLVRDLDKRIELKDVWNDITDKEDRAYLIDIAPDIFWGDGSYSPAEKELYEKMFADQMGTIDLKKVKQDMDEIAARITTDLKEQREEFEKEKEKDFEYFGLLGWLAYRFEKTFGLDEDEI